MSKLWSALGKHRFYPSIHVSENHVEELLAYLRGEPACEATLIHFLRIVRVRQKNETIPLPYSVAKLAPLVLQCTDGQVKSDMRLTRHFQLIRDFLLEYTTAETIEIPYSKQEVQLALHGLTIMPKTVDVMEELNLCLDAMRHLNPLRNTYWLCYRLRDVPPQQVRLMSEHFTTTERRELRATAGDVDLPGDGSDYSILAAAETVREDMDVYESLFSQNYPSWAVTTMCYKWKTSWSSQSLTDPPLQLLLTADFSKDTESSSSTITQYVISYIWDALKRADLTWPQMGRLMALLAIQSDDLLNNDETCGPYASSSSTMDNAVFWTAERPMLDRMKAAYPGEWKDSYFIEAAEMSPFLRLSHKPE